MLRSQVTQWTSLRVVTPTGGRERYGGDGVHVRAVRRDHPIGAPSENRSQYTGRENDGTGLYYYRTRYYHPQMQRFISEDPIGLRRRPAVGDGDRPGLGGDGVHVRRDEPPGAAPASDAGP